MMTMLTRMMMTIMMIRWQPYRLESIDLSHNMMPVLTEGVSMMMTMMNMMKMMMKMMMIAMLMEIYMGNKRLS